MKVIGIVGVGGFARTILRSILALEIEGLAHLEGAVIRNPAKYPAAIEKMKSEGRTVYVSLADMLKRGRDKIDLIAIPTGIPSHSALAIQALEAGYDVVLEKPVAATVQEVDAIVEAERRTGHFCAIGYQHIHTAAIQTLREEVENGRLGKLKRLKCYALWPRNRTYYDRNIWAGQIKSEGNWVLDGPLTNALAHFLNNMLYLLNVEGGGQATIESLRAELYRANDIPTYDTICLRAHMGSGAEVFIALTHAVDKLQNPIIEIEAENASATWAFDGAKTAIHYRDGVMRTVEGMGRYPSAQVFRDAIAVAEGNRPRPLFTAADGRNHVLAVDLAFESSGGITALPGSECKVNALGDDSRTVMQGLDSIVERAFAEFKLFSELGIPWAQPPSEVSGAGYTEFPQSARLRAHLDELVD